MKLLVIGSGGREHALAKKMLADDKVTTVFCAKGNPGMKQDGIEIVDIAEDDHESLIQYLVFFHSSQSISNHLKLFYHHLVDKPQICRNAGQPSARRH